MHTIHTFHTYTIHINIYTYHTYTLHIYTLYIQHNAYIYTHVIYIKKEELYFKAYTEKQWPVTTNKLTLVSKHLKRYIYSMDFEKLQGEWNHNILGLGRIKKYNVNIKITDIRINNKIDWPYRFY